jgi:hypothetical protein
MVETRSICVRSARGRVRTRARLLMLATTPLTPRYVWSGLRLVEPVAVTDMTLIIVYDMWARV